MNRRLIRAALATVSGVAALFIGTGIGHADTHIVVGGNTDCRSLGLMQTKIDQGDVRGELVPVAYGTCDGDFAPFLGSTPANVAIDQGVAATRQAWNDHCSDGSRCTLEGFSLGDAPVSIVGNDVGADQPGSNTHVVTNGNAWGDPGVFGPTPGPIGVFVNIGAPFASAPTDIPVVPNSENRNGYNDAWGANGGQPPWAEITQLSTINGGANGLPPQHYVPSGEPAGSYVDENGVDNKFYGEPFPGVIPPEGNPVVNPPAVHLDVPSFPGELPCEGGYFTPGDAPC